jgi:hypothetical protein
MKPKKEPVITEPVKPAPESIPAAALNDPKPETVTVSTSTPYIDPFVDGESEVNIPPAAPDVKLKADGTPAKKRGPKGPRTPRSGPAVIENGRAPATVDQSAAAGAACAMTVVTFCQVAMGSDWEFSSDDERKIHIEAWTEYFKAKNITTFPPGAALAVVLASYALTRINKPNTKTRIKTMWYWLRSKISRWKRKRAARKAVGA